MLEAGRLSGGVSGAPISKFTLSFSMLIALLMSI